MHELRRGELAQLNQIPSAPYYGAIDTTRLWIITLPETYRWTGDRQLLVVSDMERAERHVRQHEIVQISPNPQTLPDWNPVAGGIQAFYFQDPDGHNLEPIHFPTAKAAPKWQQPTTSPIPRFRSPIPR